MLFIIFIPASNCLRCITSEFVIKVSFAMFILTPTFGFGVKLGHQAITSDNSSGLDEQEMAMRVD